MIDRRSFLRRSGAGLLGVAAAGAGADLLAACGSSASSSTPAAASSSSSPALAPVSVQLSWVFDAEFSGYYIADTLGYFAKNGLRVSMTPGGPNVTVEQVVISGRATAGLDSVDFITAAKNQGADLVIIGAQFQRNPLGVLSLKKSNISSPKDLVGKNLGVPSGEYAQIKAFLQLNKINPADVKFVSYGTDPTPVANGSVDAAIAFTTTDPFLLQEKGYETATFTLADYGYNVYNDCIFVTRDTLNAKRAELVSLLKAVILGWQYDIAHPGYVVKLITGQYGKALGLSDNSQKFQNDAQIPLMQSAATKTAGLFAMSADDIAVNMETLVKAGIKPDKSIFDTSLLEEVYHGASHL